MLTEHHDLTGNHFQASKWCTVGSPVISCVRYLQQVKRLSTDAARRLVRVAAGEDKTAGWTLVTAGKNGGVEISCLISEAGGCGLLARTHTHTH